MLFLLAFCGIRPPAHMRWATPSRQPTFAGAWSTPLAVRSLRRGGPAGTSVCRRSRGWPDIQVRPLEPRAHP